MTGDAEKAYCWADVPPGELFAVRYPPGLKRYHPETKEELYCILRKNLEPLTMPEASTRIHTEKMSFK